MNIASTAKMNWTKLVVASLLMFGLFGFSAMAKEKTNFTVPAVE